MIPENIGRDDVLRAIDEIDKFGVPSRRDAKKYSVSYKGKEYPPKYVLTLANKYANGFELEPSEFSGGEMSHKFLKRLEFQIVLKGSNLWIGSDIEQQKNTTPDEELSELVVKCGVATVSIQSNGNYNLESRSELLVQLLNKLPDGVDVLLLPAGFYYTSEEPRGIYHAVESFIVEVIKEFRPNLIVCFGIDGREGMDQIALAVSKDGIEAIGRKYYPTQLEKGFIEQADSHNELEDGYSRMFRVNNTAFYLAVCYDSFGTKVKGCDNPGADVILNLVHQFYPKGQGNSGDVLFARHGFAGASQAWECPVFGAAVFFNRKVEPNWPTGVIWDPIIPRTRNWKYKNNLLSHQESLEVSGDTSENANVKTYQVSL